MRVIPPLEITDAIFTSSTCAEPSTTETAYNPATTYALGATIVVAADHRTYESLQASNIGHTPSTSPTWWLDVGPTDRWKMFDLLRNTQTVHASPLTIVLTPAQRVSALAVLGLEGSSVVVSMTSGGGLVYSSTADLNAREVGDWWDYFYAENATLPSAVFFDLPPYADGVVTISIINTNGDVSCGSLVIGSYEYIGQVQWEAVSDVLNFSTVDRDDFGNTELVARRNVPKTEQTLKVGKSLVNRVRALRDSLNAEPAVWSGLDDATDGYFEALLILGFYRKFSISVSDVNEATISLELEEI